MPYRLLYKIIQKIRANLKRHNRVYILSSKHSYRPMRARVVAQLFYNVLMVAESIFFFLAESNVDLYMYLTTTLGSAHVKFKV